MTSIQFQPLIPLALWLALAAGALVVLAWYSARRPAQISRRRWLGVMTLAGISLALVLSILLNPMAVSPVPPPAGKPLLTILVDRSASMAVADQPDGRSRFQEAATLAAKLHGGLSRPFDVELRTFADTTTSVSASQLPALKPAGQVTNLANAIAESLDGSREQGQALLVLSDGIHNAAGGTAHVTEAVQTSRAMSVPIFAFAIGGQTSTDDLDLSLVRQQELAFVGQKTSLRATVKQRGRLAAEANLELLDESGRIVEQTSVKLPPDGDAQADFYVSQPSPGLHRYQVHLAPLPREATAGNNTSTFLLRTVDRPIRVLLLEGKPYWDAKFLMRTIAHDDALELDAVIRVADDRFIQRTLRLSSDADSSAIPRARRQESTEVLQEQPAMLATSERLSEYQIVVLGREAESFLTEPVLERLRTWISRDGGSLVCFRGPPVAKLNQQLARLMPVRWSASPESRFRMQLTSRGRELSWIAAAASPSAEALAALPSLAASARPQQPSPLAVVVAQAPGQTQTHGQAQPVISYQPYGLGRVVAIEGAGMWRWAFLSSEHQQVEPIYDALWQGLMRWLVSGGGLAPGQSLALRTENVSFFSEEPAFVTLLVREGALSGDLPRVELKRPEATVGSFAPVALGDEPGVYRVSFGPLSEGAYQATVVGAAASHSETKVAFDVRPNFTEQLDTAARPDLLAQMAEKSAGAMLDGATADEIERRFKAHLARVRPLQFREVTIWDRWWVLGLVVGLWGAAWALRRHSGLI